MKWMHWMWAISASLLVSCGGSPSGGAGPGGATATAIGHVFVIVLENKDYAHSFGADSPAKYLNQTLMPKGALLTHYYGVAHVSLGNYIAMISGQGPNMVTQSDCQIFQEFAGTAPQAALDGQAVGQGCVYPATVPNITDQLRAAGRSWKGYMESMGNDAGREAATCAHPEINAQDPTQTATATDAYATRHNPFVYFRSVIDDQAYCDAHVVNLNALKTDLASIATTPEFSFITPDLCHDGHDAPCVSGEPGGLESADAFLAEWVPRILASPAFQKDGLLIVTWDESDGPQTDAGGCCGAAPTVNTPMPGIVGLGGGVVGAVLVSPFIKPNTITDTPYNHYSLLRHLQDIWGLPYLGFAGQSGQAGFGADVYTARLPVFPPRP